MKTIVKSILFLVPAVALMSGCQSNRNTTATGSPGPGVTYEQGNAPQQYQYQYNQPSAVWNSDNAVTGAPYEWQHPSPRDQMTP